MRRFLSVLVFTFAPLRRSEGVLNWWPTALAVLGTASALVGITFPKQVGGPWLALAGVAALCGLLLVAAYRLHGVAFPTFPRHKLDVGRPRVLDNPDESALAGDKKLLAFILSFYNRDPRRRVNLSVDVLWTRVVHEQALGPSALFPQTRGLDHLDLIQRNVDVAPERHIQGWAVFIAWVPGIDVGEHGSAFEAPEHVVFDIRLTDNISGAEHVQPLEVQRPGATS